MEGAPRCRRFITDAAIYADPGPGIAEMLKYLDAGRAVAVAYSLSESTRELQDALAQFGPTGDERVRGALRRLVILSKDYAEDFKRPADADNLTLPHIGWGQRLRDFTHEPSPLGIPADDSFTAFHIVVRYVAAACGDLVKVREAAIALVEAIAEVQPQLHARCEETARDIQDGIRQLKSVQDILEQTANILAEVLNQTRHRRAAIRIGDACQPCRRRSLTAAGGFGSCAFAASMEASRTALDAHLGTARPRHDGAHDVRRWDQR